MAYRGDDISLSGSPDDIREQRRFLAHRAESFLAYAIKNGYQGSFAAGARATVSVYIYVRQSREGPSAKVRFSDHAGHEAGYDVDWHFRARNSTLLSAAAGIAAAKSVL